MKSKAKLFLLPIMALAVMAFAIAGVATFNTAPAKVSAEAVSKRIVYVNKSIGYTYAYAWDTNNGDYKTLGDWPGSKMVDIGDYYVCDIGTADKVIFTKGESGGENQTGDLVYNSATPYYNSSSAWAAMPEGQAPVNYTVRFYKPAGWGETMYVHSWNKAGGNDLGSADTAWGSDPAMTDDGDGWWSTTVTKYYGIDKYVLFKDNANNTSNRTDDLNMDTGKPNYYKGLWLANKSNASTVGYYVAGTINGADCRATTNYKCITDDAYKGSDVAVLRGLRMNKDDSVYVVYGTGSTATGTTIEYKNGSGNLESIANDGMYNVFLYNSDGYKVSCAEVAPQEVAMTSTYYKKSTDSNYLLLATGFDFANLTRETFSNYSLAYYINGVKHELDKYYSGITLGENVYEPVNIFGATGFTTDKIMAYEIGDGTGALTGNTYTVQAVVMYDGAVISFSPYVIHTVA